jgi:hypothetical protein
MIHEEDDIKPPKIMFIIMFLFLIYAIVVYITDDSLGAYTNGKTENCSGYIYIAFDEDRFVSVINFPVDSEIAGNENLADRIGQSADGEYFYRIVQRGNFYITDDGNEKTLVKVLPNGGTIKNSFTQSRNGISFGGTELGRVDDR